jgi:hypothetical protein
LIEARCDADNDDAGRRVDRFERDVAGGETAFAREGESLGDALRRRDLRQVDGADRLGEA